MPSREFLLKDGRRPLNLVKLICLDLINLLQYIPWLADLYAKGQFPLQKLQKTYMPQDINQACRDMLDGKVLKPILLWD